MPAASDPKTSTDTQQETSPATKIKISPNQPSKAATAKISPKTTHKEAKDTDADVDNEDDDDKDTCDTEIDYFNEYDKDKAMPRYFWCVCENGTDACSAIMCDKCKYWFHETCFPNEAKRTASKNSDECDVCFVCRGDQALMQKYATQLEFRKTSQPLVVESVSSSCSDLSKSPAEKKASAKKKRVLESSTSSLSSAATSFNSSSESSESETETECINAKKKQQSTGGKEMPEKKLKLGTRIEISDLNLNLNTAEKQQPAKTVLNERERIENFKNRMKPVHTTKLLSAQETLSKKSRMQQLKSTQVKLDRALSAPSTSGNAAFFHKLG